MAKSINIELSGKNYTLTYTRNSVKTIEALGFRSSGDFLSMPITAYELIFYGAFAANHPEVSRAKANELLDIFMSEYNVDGFMEALIDMIGDTLPNSKKDNKEKKTFEIKP